MSRSARSNRIFMQRQQHRQKLGCFERRPFSCMSRSERRLEPRTRKVECTFGIDSPFYTKRIVCAENRIHFSLTWPFGSLTRTSGSVRCARAFFGEVDPVRRQKCGPAKTRADSMPMESALGPSFGHVDGEGMPRVEGCLQHTEAQVLQCGSGSSQVLARANPSGSAYRQGLCGVWASRSGGPNSGTWGEGAAPPWAGRPLPPRRQACPGAGPECWPSPCGAHLSGQPRDPVAASPFQSHDGECP
jgi:hypothetical protein